MRGFTLLEILIVIGVSLILFYLIIPVGLDFYKSQQLENETGMIVQTLKKAQLKAMAAESDSKFGVYINNDNYILFRGNSYASRNNQYDEVFDLSGSITIVDPPKEIVFSKIEGTPSFTGEIIFNSGNQTWKILINKFGVISIE
jgi:prepilin-type N-terminal cleavage/methylation domain-containing protein